MGRASICWFIPSDDHNSQGRIRRRPETTSWVAGNHVPGPLSATSQVHQQRGALAVQEVGLDPGTRVRDAGMSNSSLTHCTTPPTPKAEDNTCSLRWRHRNPLCCCEMVQPLWESLAIPHKVTHSMRSLFHS